MTRSAPFQSSLMTVEPGWIDYNGHMNMAYYNVLFDRCADEVYEVLGFGPDYAQSRRLTTYTAEFHICYVRELHLDDPVRISFQMLDHNDRSFHSYQEIHHTDGWLAATAEALVLHVDMEGPKVAPFADDTGAAVAAMKQAHAGLGRPDRAGRGIAIRHKG